MKNIKKHIALLLALCLIAILPLTAAAQTELSGTWGLIASYNSETEEYNGSLDSSTSKIILSADGSAAYYIGDESFSSTWAYSQTDEEGNEWYTFTLNYNGSVLPLTMMYSEGNIYLVISNTVYIYSQM